MAMQRTYNSQNDLKIKQEDLHYLMSRLTIKLSVMWRISRRVNMQTNGTRQSPETDRNIYGLLVFKKDVKVIEVGNGHCFNKRC